jgi:hypothetical protein
MRCWRSVDTLLMLCWASVDPLLMLCWHWLLCVATSTLTWVPRKDANTSIMGKCRSTALGLNKMQHPQLLMLCWRSFSEWRCDYVVFRFANKGCQYVDYGEQQGTCFSINLLATLKIVDALLTLIFRTGHLSDRFLFDISRLPICWLWITVSILWPN